MTANKPASADSFRLGSDLAKIDAHVITPEEYEEIPELTDEDFARGEIRIGDKVIRPGRPPLAAPKRAVNIRLSQDVLQAFKADGPGWQTRINAALQEWLAARRPPAKA